MTRKDFIGLLIGGAVILYGSAIVGLAMVIVATIVRWAGLGSP